MTNLSIPYNLVLSKYLTVHVVINLTENIARNLDKGNIGCGISVDLQKALDAFQHVFSFI